MESGVSQARVAFAFNSVNVEGWALYQEAEMKPYMPLEGEQAVALAETLAHIAGIMLPVFTSYLGHKYLTFRE